MNVLLTGGAGYIASHTIIELHEKGHSVVVVDNFSNSCPESLKRVGEIIGSAGQQDVHKSSFCEVRA